MLLELWELLRLLQTGGETLVFLWAKRIWFTGFCFDPVKWSVSTYTYMYIRDFSPGELTSTQASCVPNKNIAIPSSRYKYTYSLYIIIQVCTTYTVEYGLLGSSYFTSTVFTLPVWYLYLAIHFPLTTSQWTTDVSPDAVIWWLGLLNTQDSSTGSTYYTCPYQLLPSW